jgi:hypothetical protein
MIAHAPLHRSGRAALPHPAPTLGHDAEAHHGIGMTDRSRRKPPYDKASHTAPRQVVALAATAQHRLPQADHCHAEGAQRWAIHGHSVISEVTQQDRAQIRSLFRDGRVHAPPQFVFQRPQLGLPPLPHRLSQHREVTLPGFPAAMRESRPTESHREPLAEPDMNLSAHPAPIKQTLRSYRYPSVRRVPFVPGQAFVGTGSPGPYGI